MSIFVPFKFNPSAVYTYIDSASVTDSSGAGPTGDSSTDTYTVPVGKYAFVRIVGSASAAATDGSTREIVIPQLIFKEGDVITVAVNANADADGPASRGWVTVTINSVSSIVCRAYDATASASASYIFHIEEYNV